MNPWTATCSTLQGYLATNVSLMPSQYLKYLTALEVGERHHQVSMLPIAKLELHHLRVQAKINARFRTIGQMVVGLK